MTKLLRDLNEDWALEVSSPGPERPLTKPEHFRRFLGSRVRVKTSEEIEGHRSFTGRLTDADDETVSVDSGDGPVAIPLAAVRRSNLLPDGANGGGRMTQEIVDAVKALEQEKGIASDTLMDALEDALLSAYKKTPGAAKYAKVELDHGTADFRVFELMVPEDLEKRLLDEQFEDQLAGRRGGRGRRRAGARDPDHRPTRRPRDRRAPRARGAGARARAARALHGPDQDPATSPPTTSGASPPRPPSR